MAGFPVLRFDFSAVCFPGWGFDCVFADQSDGGRWTARRPDSSLQTERLVVYRGLVLFGRIFQSLAEYPAPRSVESDRPGLFFREPVVLLFQAARSGGDLRGPALRLLGINDLGADSEHSIDQTRSRSPGGTERRPGNGEAVHGGGESVHN